MPWLLVVGSLQSFPSRPSSCSLPSPSTCTLLPLGAFPASGNQSMPDQAPPPGLYQQLLTEGLEQQLRDLQGTLVATDGLDPQ